MAFPWAAFTVRVARDVGTKLDIDILPQDGQSNSPKQSSDLRNAVNQGVDGVLLAANRCERTGTRSKRRDRSQYSDRDC